MTGLRVTLTAQWMAKVLCAAYQATAPQWTPCHLRVILGASGVTATIWNDWIVSFSGVGPQVPMTSDPSLSTQNWDTRFPLSSKKAIFIYHAGPKDNMPQKSRLSDELDSFGQHVRWLTKALASWTGLCTKILGFLHRKLWVGCCWKLWVDDAW